MGMTLSFLKYYILLLLTCFLCGCREPAGSPLPSPQLAGDLNVDDLDSFYRDVSQNDIALVRAAFAEKAKSGHVFNYGVLVNANIITDDNQALFKPSLDEIEQFREVPNQSHCFMNSALYNIANSNFFDELLELDRLRAEAWNKRTGTTLALANPILRTLRETIYEIRLGKRTTPERIAHMRARHVATLSDLDSLEIAQAVYVELLTLYSFEKVEHLLIDSAGAKVHEYRQIDHFRNIDESLIKSAVENFRYWNSRGALGSLSKSLHNNQDLVYLDAIFSIVDPWGTTARFIEAAIVHDRFPLSKLRAGEIYEAKLMNTFSIPLEQGVSLKVFHNVVMEDPIKNQMFSSRMLRSASSKAELGRIIYRYDITEFDANFQLIAKSKHSSNHQIAEVFRRKQNAWETHTFFGPPKVAAIVSGDDEDGYKDFLYYFERRY
jgi:hypothetical protein